MLRKMPVKRSSEKKYMSLKQLLGLNETGISDYEIIKKIREAQHKNIHDVEFNMGGDIVKISLPDVHFDPNADDRDSW